MEKILPKQKKAQAIEDAPKASEVIAATHALQTLNARPSTPEDRIAFAEARLRVQEAKRREAELEESDDAFWDSPEGRKVAELMEE